MSRLSDLSRLVRFALLWCGAYALWLSLGALWFDEGAPAAGGMLVASVLAVWADARRPRGDR